MTIPGVGDIVAATLYACIGDVTRFPNAKSLAAYVGLVPSVRQSADTNVLGRITKQGSPQLRRLLVQAAHAVSSRCQIDAAMPIQVMEARGIVTHTPAPSGTARRRYARRGYAHSCRGPKARPGVNPRDAVRQIFMIE